jgi:DNA-binding transcriptional LysR family regulator
VNTQNLNYFITLAEEQSFSRAADKLFISQQALSKYIRRMEDELGTPCFERRPVVRLTETGQLFLDAAKKIITIESDLRRSLYKKDTQSLNIGVSGRMHNTLFFRRLCPNSERAIRKLC